MSIKIAIADDNTFLVSAVKEKLSFFEEANQILFPVARFAFEGRKGQGAS